MPDLGAIWTGFVNSAVVQLGVRFIGLYLFVLYIAQIFWTYRDAQNRTENRVLPVLAALLVTAVPVLGLFVYLIVRSRETISEAYERQLAEESLLAEAEQRIVCPTCHERVQEDFILCPTCRTRLKRVCPSCAKLIRPEWNICPYCAKDFDERDWTVHTGGKVEPVVAGKGSPTARRSAVAIAEAVLYSTGGVGGLARADPAALGLGPATAARVVAALELGRRALAAERDGDVLDTPAAAARALAPHLAHRDREALVVALLTRKQRLIAVCPIYAGHVSGTSVRIGELFTEALRRNAAGSGLRPHHPPADPQPPARELPPTEGARARAR